MNIWDEVKGAFRVAFTPACWVVVSDYSSEWDVELNALMKKHRFYIRRERTVFLGPVELWIANHPYCSFTSYRFSLITGTICGPRPRRITALRAMDKLNAECRNSSQ